MISNELGQAVRAARLDVGSGAQSRWQVASGGAWPPNSEQRREEMPAIWPMQVTLGHLPTRRRDAPRVERVHKIVFCIRSHRHSQRASLYG